MSETVFRVSTREILRRSKNAAEDIAETVSAIDRLRADLSKACPIAGQDPGRWLDALRTERRKKSHDVTFRYLGDWEASLANTSGPLAALYGLFCEQAAALSAMDLEDWVSAAPLNQGGTAL